MKKQALHLNTPCTESWDNMDILDQGRFCHSCEKTVVDFTQMSDAEILTFFETHKGQRICGRMKKSQLERPLAKPPVPAPPAQRRGTGLQLMLAALAVSAWMVGTTPVVRAASLPKIEQQSAFAQFHEPASKGLTGKVMEKEGRAPIANAVVDLLDADNNIIASTNTDEKGVFSFSELPDNVAHIQIYSPGYEYVFQPFNKKAKKLEFLLDYEHELMGDVMIEE